MKDIGMKLREFLPLATDLASCVVTERGKEEAKERLQRLHLLADMLDSELTSRNQYGEI